MKKMTSKAMVTANGGGYTYRSGDWVFFIPVIGWFEMGRVIIQNGVNNGKGGKIF